MLVLPSIVTTITLKIMGGGSSPTIAREVTDGSNRASYRFPTKLSDLMKYSGPRFNEDSCVCASCAAWVIGSDGAASCDWQTAVKNKSMARGRIFILMLENGGNFVFERPHWPALLASGIRACSAGEMPEVPKPYGLGQSARSAYSSLIRSLSHTLMIDCRVTPMRSAWRSNF